MKTLKIIITISFVLLINNRCWSQKDTKMIAESLMLEHEIWQTDDDSLKDQLLFEKAMLFKDNQAYENQFFTLQRILDKDVLVLYELGLNRFLMSYYQEAYFYLKKIKRDHLTSNRNIGLLWALVLMETHRYEDCRNYLLSQCNIHDSILPKIKQLPVSIDYKSPDKALKYSSFFPGLGLFYTKHYLRGLISFTLQGGFAYLTGLQIYHGYYISSFAAGVYPFWRFYSGGKRLSSSMAEVHNKKAHQILEEQYKRLIFEIYFHSS